MHRSRIDLFVTNFTDVDAEAEEVLNELNLLTAEGDDTNMSTKIEDSDWTKSMGKWIFESFLPLFNESQFSKPS